MNVMSLYKSKSFLFRMLLSFSLLVVGCLLVLSLTAYSYFEKNQLEVQYKANVNVLSQVDRNIFFLEQIVRNLAVSVFFDDGLYALRFGTEPEDYVTKMNQLNKIYNNAPFLHSVVFYNPRIDRFFSSSGGSTDMDNEQMFVKLREYVRLNPDLPKMKLIPLYRDETRNAPADTPIFFSYMLYDSLGRYAEGDSLLFLNVRPDWILDQVKRIAGRDDKAFVLDASGNVLLKDSDSTVERELLDRLNGGESADSGGSAKNRAETGYSLASAGGKRYIATRMQIASIGWTVVFVQPVDNVLLRHDRLKWALAALTFALILLSLALSFAISRKLYRPIEAMIREIRGSGALAPADAPHESADADELTLISAYQQRLADRVQTMSRDRQNALGITKKYFLRRLLLGSQTFGEDELRQIRQAVHLPLGERMAVIAFCIDDFKAFQAGRTHSEQQLIVFAVSSIVREIVGEAYPCEVIDMRNDLLAAVVALPWSTEEAGLLPLIADARRYAGEYYHVSLTVGVSAAAGDCRRLSAAYQEAVRLTEERFVHGRGLVFTGGLIRGGRQTDRDVPGGSALVNVSAGAAFPSSGEPDAAALAACEQQMLDALKLNEYDRFAEALRTFSNALSECAYEQIMPAVMHMLFALNQACREIGYNMVRPIEIRLLIPEVFEQETLGDVVAAVTEAVRPFFAQRSLARSEKSETLVFSIKEIVLDKYMDPDMNVQKIASLLKMSAVYIGKVFKANEMISIIDYINDVRLIKAQELLANRDLTVNEIMEAVGYSNHSHFFRLFKKKYGTTPKAYKLTRSLNRTSEN